MQYQIQGQPYPVVVLTVEPEETVLCQKNNTLYSKYTAAPVTLRAN